jgi:hypothetical protein
VIDLAQQTKQQQSRFVLPYKYSFNADEPRENNEDVVVHRNEHMQAPVSLPRPLASLREVWEELACQLLKRRGSTRGQVGEVLVDLTWQRFH